MQQREEVLSSSSSLVGSVCSIEKLGCECERERYRDRQTEAEGQRDEDRKTGTVRENDK
jgi:hypothetical protein